MDATSGYQKDVINGEKKAFPRPFHILLGPAGGADGLFFCLERMLRKIGRS